VSSPDPVNDRMNRVDAMPADVAANTAYTFAAEGQIRAASGSSYGTAQEGATFSGDALFYVATSGWSGGGEDLVFNPGTIIPGGAFNRSSSSWEPTDNGLVIEVTCAAGGVATVLPTWFTLPTAEASALCASPLVPSLGVAVRFWRVPVRHFSPVDFNLLQRAPVPFPGSSGGAGGGPIASGSPDGGGVGGGHGDDSSTCAPGSIIHCEGRAVSETIPLIGTGANLVYHSAHHRGRAELFTVFVRPVDMAAELGFLSDTDGDPTVGASSLTARSEVFVGGQRIGFVNFNNAQLLARTVTPVLWNGLDAFGRPVQGVVEAQIRTLYTMTLPFCSNSASSGAIGGAIGPRQFGIQSTDLSCTSSGRGVLSVRRDEFVEVGTVNDGLRGLGGWAVDVNHTYDPASSMLFYGNGRRRSVSVADAGTSTIRRRVVLDATSSPALSAANWHIRDMDVSPDGTVYFTLGVDEYPNSATPVSPGTGLYRLLPDASTVQLVATDTAHPFGVTVHRDGSVWVTDAVPGCIRRYQTTGAPPWSGQVMVGNCATVGASLVGLYGNGMPATGPLENPSLFEPAGIRSIAARADGSVYFAEHDGRADDDLFRYRPIGGATGLVDVVSLPGVSNDITALERDGGFGILFGQDGLLRQLMVDGSVLATAGGVGPDADLVARNVVRLFPSGFAAGLGGDIFAAAFGPGPGIQRVVRISGAFAESVVGSTEVSPSNDDAWTLTTPNLATTSPRASARRAWLRDVDDLVQLPTGYLLIADNHVSSTSTSVTERIVFYSVQPPYDTTTTSTHSIVSEDRTQIFEFEGSGRHLRTRDLLSGHVLWSFGYDTQGRLTSITDREGQTTSIVHGATSITVTAPGSLTTTLTINSSSGYATSVASPGNERIWTLGHTHSGGTLGLLNTLRMPSEIAPATHSFTYDGLGRLATDVDVPDTGTGTGPSQGITEAFVNYASPALITGPLSGVRTVTLTSPQSRLTTFAMRRDGARVWTRMGLPTGGYRERLDRGDSRGLLDVRDFDGSMTAVARERDPLYDLDAPYVASVRHCRPSTVTGATQSCDGVSAGADAAAGSGTPGATVVSRARTFVGTSTLNETTTVDGLTWARETNFGTRTIIYSPPNQQNVTLRFDAQGRLERIEPYAQYPVCISYTGHRVSSVRQGNFATCASTAPPVRRAVSFGYGTGSRRWLEDVTVGHTATTLLTDLTPSPNRGLVTSALLPGRTQQSFFEYDADDRLRRIAPAGHYTGTTPPAAASDNGDYQYTYTGRGFFATEETPVTTHGTTLETSGTTYTNDRQFSTRQFRGTNQWSAAYHPTTGVLTSLTAGTETFTLLGHDALGRPATIQQLGASGFSSFGYTRDGFAVPTQETLAIPGYTGSLTRTVSTQHGRLTREQIANDGTSLAIDYTTRPGTTWAAMDPVFFAAAATRGSVASTGTLSIRWMQPATASDTSLSQHVRTDAISGGVTFQTLHGYNAWGELQRLGTTYLGTTWFADEICARDDVGRILRRYETYRTGVGTAVEYLRYTYSYSNGRLSGVNTYRHTTAITCSTTTGGTLISSSSGLYGVVSNTLNRVFTNGAYNGEDQLTAEGATGSVRSYGWDNRGRLISRSATGSTNGFTYGWDSRDHMTSSTNTTASTTRTYQYDPSGRLVAARGGGLTDEFFVYRDGTEPIAWSRGGVHQYYVYGSQRHVPDLIYEDTDGDVEIDNVYRVLTDERGSVRMVVSLAATPFIAQRIEYDVFGNPTFPVGGETVQPFGFAGAIWLGHARFWHMGARDYDPAVGRWTSKDPIRFAGGTNLYVYCEGDPVNFVDPSGLNGVLGLMWEQAGEILGAAALGGVISGGVAAATTASTGGSFGDVVGAFAGGFVGGFLGTLAFEILVRAGVNDVYATGVQSCLSAGVGELIRQGLSSDPWDPQRLAAVTGLGVVTGVGVGAVWDVATAENFAVLPVSGRAVVNEAILSGWNSLFVAGYDLTVNR
jgi:RHS repeat-associated protein